MPAVLFACFEGDERALDAVDAWYDRDHLPGRMAVAGFRRATRYRGHGSGASRATACLYDLASTAVLESDAYLSLQEQTAEDTARHLAGLEVHRLVGDLRGGAEGVAGDREPSPFLLAAVEPASGRSGTAPPVRRYASSREGQPCDLVLRDLDRRPDDPAALAGADAVRWWLLEQIGVADY